MNQAPDLRREDLREAVALRKEELSRALETFKEAIRDPVDLRRRVATRPWGYLAATFVVGFWLGTRNR